MCKRGISLQIHGRFGVNFFLTLSIYASHRILYKGPSVKDVHSQWRGDLSSAVIFRTILQMQTSALLQKIYAKSFGFFEICDVSARTRGKGVKPVQTFCGQPGRGINFSQFCADVFYGRPLTLF